MAKIQAKNLLKSKLFWLGVATTALSAFTFIQENSVNPTVLGIIGILIMILRYFTSQPVSFK